MSIEIGTSSENQETVMNSNARSELHLAVCIEDEQRALEQVNSLLASGKNPNIQDSFGQSPVHLAARADRVAVLEALLAAGGCPLLGDLACLSAIDVAARFNSTKCLKLFSTLLDSDVQQKDEPLKATLDFWRRGTVVVTLPSGGSGGACSDASFHSCTSHTRNWVLSTAKYRGAGDVDASLDCSVCSLAAEQSDQAVNSGDRVQGAGSTRLRQTADCVLDVHTENDTENQAMCNNLGDGKFSETNSQVKFRSKSGYDGSVRFEQVENEQQSRHSVVSGEEKYSLPNNPETNSLGNLDGKQIYVNFASEDVFEYESNVDHDSIGAASLTKITEGNMSCTAGVGLDAILPLTPVSLSEENKFFDQMETTRFNSNFEIRGNEIDDDMNNNSNNFTVTSQDQKLICTKLKSSSDNCTRNERSYQISPSVPRDHLREARPPAPAADHSSIGSPEYSSWEPSTLVERDLNTAFLRSDSFISFMNQTKYTSKSSSLFSGYSFYRDAEDEEKKNKEAAHGNMDVNVEKICYQKDSIALKNSKYGVDNKSEMDAIPLDKASLNPCQINKGNFVSVPSFNLPHLNSAQSSVVFKALDDNILSQDVSKPGGRCSADIEDCTQTLKQLDGKRITETELLTHLGKIEAPSVLVLGKPPKCAGNLKSARKRSFGVVSHKLHAAQVGVKPKRLKQTEGHSSKVTSVVEFFENGGSVAQEVTSYTLPSAAQENTPATPTVQEKVLVSDKVKEVVPPKPNCNTLNGIQHHTTARSPAMCELQPNNDCLHLQTRRATPPLRKKFDLADTYSCSSSSRCSQIDPTGKGNNHLKALVSATKTPASPSPSKAKTNTAINSGNKFTPNNVLKRVKNAMGSSNVMTNKYGSPKVTANNPRVQLPGTPTSQSKYRNVSNYTPNTLKSSEKKYSSPKTPVTKTPRPIIKRFLSSQKSNKYERPASPYSASKQTAPCVTPKSDKKKKIKVAFNTPWRPPVSIVVTAATPLKKQTAIKGVKTGITRTPNNNLNAVTVSRKGGVDSRACLDEAIGGVDNTSPNLLTGTDSNLKSNRRYDEVTPKDCLSPVKRPDERTNVEDEIPFGLSSAVFDLVRKFNTASGVAHSSRGKCVKDAELPPCDPVAEVGRNSECVSAPVQDLFVGSPVTPPRPSNPILNHLHDNEDSADTDSDAVRGENLSNKILVAGLDFRNDNSLNVGMHSVDTSADIEVSNDKRSCLNSNPISGNLLTSNHSPRGDAKRPVPCSNVTFDETGVFKLPLPTSGPSHSLPVTNTHQALPSSAPVTCPKVLSSPTDVKALPSSTPGTCPKVAKAGSTVSGTSAGSALTIVEEYVYADPECGVTLIERRCPSLASVSGTLRSLATTGSRGQGKESGDRFNDSAGKNEASQGSRAGSVLSSLPDSIVRLSAGTLSRELAAAGSALTGPVTETTARVYARLLHNIRQGRVAPSHLTQADDAPQYSRELRQALQDPDAVPWDSYRSLEQRMSSVFTSPRPLDYWRGGSAKVCFNYLLLDPAITQDLPLRAAALSPSELFRVFVSAVFYVGKGCKARPYAHLYQALQEQDRRAQALDNPDVPKPPPSAVKVSPPPQPPAPSRGSSAEKVSRILGVWEAGGGVVSLHVFQHTIPAEAWTREAAMIDAIGLNNLSNCVGGSYYGPARGFPNCDRRALGVVLLHRAMLMLLCEGERQLRPPDLPPNPWANRTKKTRHNTPTVSP